MTGFVNPLAPKVRNIPAASARIKEWVRRHLALDDSVTISVTELTCREPGCPDVETVVGILEESAPVRTFRFHKPISDVHEAEVAEQLADQHIS